MPRFATLSFAVLALAVSARADALWQLSDDYDNTPRKPAPEKTGPAPALAILPLSGNIILGRVQWVDTPKRLGILVLHKSPARTDELLVARDADCTPRAVLRQVPTGTRPGVLAVKVVAGELKPGMEIVLPVEKLLKECSAKLPAHETKPEKPAPASAPQAHEK